MNIKKNHHYVSQFYLKSWSKCGDSIYTSIKEKPTKMKVNKIASSNYFYRAQTINENTREMLISLAQKTMSPPHDVRDSIIGIINTIYLIDEIKNTYEGCHNKESIQIEKKIKTNYIEDYYSIIESLAAPEINKIIENDLGNISIIGYQRILRYITHQLTRTNVVKEKFKIESEQLMKSKKINFQSYNVISSLILAEETMLSLIEKLYKISIIENNTETNFITNDNPAINLNPITMREMKVYIPISPKIALFIEPTNIKTKEKKEFSI